MAVNEENVPLTSVLRGFLLLVGKAVGVLVGIGICFWIATALTIGWPIAKTHQGKIAVVVGGGPFDANTIHDVKRPEDGIYFKGWYDDAYEYPTTQRSYIISVSDSESDTVGTDAIVPSRDGVPMQFETAAYFKLNEDLISEFHREIGIKTQAWTNDGWNRMLDQYFRKIEQDTIRTFARQYTVDELYCPECSSGGGRDIDDLLTRAEEQIGGELGSALAAAQGRPYFCGPDSGSGECTAIRFVINGIRPANESVLAKYAELRTSATEIDIQENKVRASELEARAARKLTGQGTLSDQYLRLRYIEALRRAVDRGGIDFWVLNGSENITLPGPGRD